MHFNDEHHVACKLSIVHGELRRYTKGSSAHDDYIGLAAQLRQRLHMIYDKAFAFAPQYEQRSVLLALDLKQKSDNDVPALVFATTYSP